ncbi:MAG TPA: hypothetical protein VG496_00950 [Myxococcales bacterium]|nr:hypothetical protein [Myxococcales bacterium]
MRVLFTASAAFLVACASSTSSGPPAVEVHPTGVPGEAAAVSHQKISATVVTVNAATRMLTLQGQDGHIETVKVPPEVKRFNEIAPGDRIVVEVQEGLLFQYQPVGSPYVAPAAVIAAERASAAEPPAVAAGGAVQSTVVIIGVDTGSRIVDVEDLDGNKFHVKADPKLAIEKLKIGDRLIATYATTVAISLEK